MIIYNYFKTPEELYGYDKSAEIPSILLKKYGKYDKVLLAKAKAFTKYPQDAYLYARDILHGRFEAGEDIIATSKKYSFNYAEYVINGRFEKGEDIISTDAKASYNYANEILNGPFPKGEDIISTDAEYSFYYARDVLNYGRFEKGEAAIAKDPEYAYSYAMRILEDRFPASEDVIMNSKYKDKYSTFIKNL